MKIVQVSESEFSVQGHGVHTAFIETTRGLKKAGMIVTINKLFFKADIRHIHTVGPYSVLNLLFGSGKKIVSAHVVPASFVGSLRGAEKWLGFATWYLRWFYNRASVVIAVSDTTKNELQKIGVKRPISVVYNMIDASYYKYNARERNKLRKKFQFGPKDIVVLGNGQVQPRKRVDTFVALAHMFPQMQFVWVGGMPFGKVAAKADEMQAMMDATPKNVQFTGVVSLSKVRDYFAAGDIFLMTSTQETFGLAVVEAAASNMPIVLRDIPDYDNTFRPYAIMCSDETFAVAIKKLSSNQEYYALMQKKSAQLARRYDTNAVIERLLEVYRHAA